jgi:16S rRNA (guanine527-N7)-methyltransferase
MPQCGTAPDVHRPADAFSAGPLTPRQEAQVVAYRDLLLEWNQRFNLTAITDPDLVERRLFADAWRMLPAIDAVTYGQPARLIDVGSGAGFPGLALKIARPALDVTLLEATAKKVTFLRHVVETLGLEGVEAIHDRAEEFGHDPGRRERYDLATARAVASLPALIELCTPFLKIGGHALFPKSEQLDQELQEGKKAAQMLGVRMLSADLVPAIEGEQVTRLVIAAKIRRTPPQYPRRAGVPAREPLGRVLP